MKFFFKDGKIMYECTHAHVCILIYMLKFSPCTNHPVKCAITGCPETIWSYNMSINFKEKHPNSISPIVIPEIELEKSVKFLKNK